MKMTVQALREKLKFLVDQGHINPDDVCVIFSQKNDPIRIGKLFAPSVVLDKKNIEDLEEMFMGFVEKEDKEK